MSVGAIDVSGGSCGGGTLAAQTHSTAAIAGELSADSSSGAAGAIALGGETVQITGKVHATGLSLSGGALTVDG